METQAEHNIVHNNGHRDEPVRVEAHIKFLQNFNNFFSNVSKINVADSTPEGTQIELMHALKRVQ